MEVVTGYKEPTVVTSLPSNSNMLVIATRAGRVMLVNTSFGTAVKYQTPFLGIAGRVNLSSPGSGEDGLTGFAFDPRYSDPTHRWVYAYYTPKAAPGVPINEARVERFWVPIETPLRADADSGEIVWENEDALGNGFGTIHVSGSIHFHPINGKLYIGVGDNASPGQQKEDKAVAQQLGNYWGKMLRIDADGSVPSNNPLLTTPGAKPEIWAYGLRNPFGFSFDSMTGDLWIGDVGQSSREEIDVERLRSAPFTALNYGWPCYEGTVNGPGIPPPQSGQDPIAECTPAPLVESPHLEYDHDANGSAVLGGYVYRGTGIDWDSDGDGDVDGLEVRYFYGDYIENKIWSISPNDPGSPPAVTEHTADLDMPALFGFNDNMAGFGQDASGELYVIKVDSTQANLNEPSGTIYRLMEE